MLDLPQNEVPYKMVQIDDAGHLYWARTNDMTIALDDQVLTRNVACEIRTGTVVRIEYVTERMLYGNHPDNISTWVVDRR